MRHPSLLARQLANHATLERDLAEAVAARPGPSSAPVRPIVLAAGFLSSLRIAMRMWIEEDLAREPHGGDRRDPGRDGSGVRVRVGGLTFPARPQQLTSASRNVFPVRPGSDWHNDSTLERTKPPR